jgi:hypothetical protein
MDKLSAQSLQVSADLFLDLVKLMDQKSAVSSGADNRIKLLIQSEIVRTAEHDQVLQAPWAGAVL